MTDNDPLADFAEEASRKLDNDVPDEVVGFHVELAVPEDVPEENRHAYLRGHLMKMLAYELIGKLTVLTVTYECGGMSHLAISTAPHDALPTPADLPDNSQHCEACGGNVQSIRAATPEEHFEFVQAAFATLQALTD